MKKIWSELKEFLDYIFNSERQDGVHENYDGSYDVVYNGETVFTIDKERY